MRVLRILRAAFAALLLAAAGPARAGELEPWVQELFQWGEYDSLIHSLEPWLAARSAGADARADSVELARANIFLGVAYAVTDKPGLGDQAFARACRLDPSSRLDRFYATPEIVARFDSISVRERNARPAPAPVRPQATASAAADGKGPQAKARKPGVGWKGWTVGILTTAGLAVGGGVVYYVLVDRKTPVTEVPVGDL